MADIATLGIVVNYDDKKDAATKLNAIATSAAAAEKAVEKLNTSSKKASDGLKSHSSATEKASKSYLQYVSDMKKITAQFDNVSGTQKGLKDLQKNLAALDKETKKAYESGKMHLDGYNKLGTASDALTQKIKAQTSALKDQTGSLTTNNRLAAESKAAAQAQTQAVQAHQVALKAVAKDYAFHDKAAQNYQKLLKATTTDYAYHDKAAKQYHANLKQTANILRNEVARDYAYHDKAAQQYHKSLQTSTKHNKSLLGSIMDARAAFVTYSLAIGAVVYTIKAVSQAIFDAGQKTIVANNTYKAITGSAQAANVEFQYLRKTAEDLGLNFYTLRDGYKGFLAAAQSSKIPMEEVRKIFTSVSNAGAVLGLSNERMSLTFLALEQMLSKGKVSMEEIRRQMGDNLPGAFQIGAKAMGMTVEAFDKAVSAGEIYSDEFLPKFRLALDEAFQGSVPESAKALNKLAEAWEDLKNRMADGEFMDSIVKGMKDITEMLKDPDFIEGMSGAAALLGKMVEYSARITAAVGKDYGLGISQGNIRDYNALGIVEENVFSGKGIDTANYGMPTGTDEQLKAAVRYYDELIKLSESASEKISKNSETSTDNIQKYMGLSAKEIEALIKTTTAEMKSFEDSFPGGPYKDTKKLQETLEKYLAQLTELDKAYLDAAASGDRLVNTVENQNAAMSVSPIEREVALLNQWKQSQQQKQTIIADGEKQVQKLIDKSDEEEIRSLEKYLVTVKGTLDEQESLTKAALARIAEIRKKDSDKALAEAKKAAAPIEAQLQEMAKAQELLDTYKRKGNDLSENELAIMAEIEAMLVNRAALEEQYYQLTGQHSKTEVSGLEAVQKKLKDETALKKELLALEKEREKLRKEATERFRATAQFMSDVLQDEVEVGEDAAEMLEKIYSSQIPITKELQADIAELNKLRERGLELAQDQQAINGKTDYDELVQQKKIIEGAKEHIKAIEKSQKAYEDFSDTIKDNIKDILKSHENMAEKIISIFEDMLYEIVATIISQNIVVPIGLQIGSALGASWNGTSFSSMSGSQGGMGIFDMASTANSLYNTASTFSSGVDTFLGPSGLGGKIGSTIFGSTAWFGAGGTIGAELVGGAATGAMAGTGAGGFAASGSAMAAGGGGMAAGAAAAIPYIGMAIAAAMILMEMMSEEKDPVVAFHFGSDTPYEETYTIPGWAETGDADTTATQMTQERPGSTTSDMGFFTYSQLMSDETNSAMKDYFEAQFTAIDESLSINLMDVLAKRAASAEAGDELAGTGWNPETYGGIEATLAVAGEWIAKNLAQGVAEAYGLNGLTNGVDGTAADFFESIMPEGSESLIDAFIRFGTVMDATEDSANALANQIELLGGDTTQAFLNLETILSVFASIDEMMSPVLEVSDPLTNIIDTFETWIETLNEANATLEQVAEAEELRTQALGLQITGLSATSVETSLKSAITGQGDIGDLLNSVIGDAIATNLATSLTNDVMDTAILPFVDAVGQAYTDSGNDLEAVFGVMPELMELLDLEGTQTQIASLATEWQNLFSGMTADEKALADAAEEAAEAFAAMVETTDSLTESFNDLVNPGSSGLGWLSEDENSEYSDFTSFLSEANAYLIEMTDAGLDVTTQFEALADQIKEANTLLSMNVAEDRMLSGDVDGMIEAIISAAVNGMEYEQFTTDGQFNAGSFNDTYATLISDLVDNQIIPMIAESALSIPGIQDVLAAARAYGTIDYSVDAATGEWATLNDTVLLDIDTYLGQIADTASELGGSGAAEELEGVISSLADMRYVLSTASGSANFEDVLGTGEYTQTAEAAIIATIDKFTELLSSTLTEGISSRLSEIPESILAAWDDSNGTSIEDASMLIYGIAEGSAETLEEALTLMSGALLSGDIDASQFALLSDAAVELFQGLADSVEDISSSSAYLNEQMQLQIELLELQGFAEEALALSRQMEIDALQESYGDASGPLEELLAQIWELEDAATAAAEAAEYLAEEQNLQIRLYEAQGDTVSALYLERSIELAELQAAFGDASGPFEDMLQQIWVLEDAATAAAEAAEVLSEAETVFADAQTALQDYIDGERELIEAREAASESINDFINDLMGSDQSPVQSMEFFEQRYAQLLADAQNATPEDIGDAVSTLTDFASQYLDFAGSYGGDYASVFGQVTEGLLALGVDQLTAAEQQSNELQTVEDLIGTTNEILFDLNEAMQTFIDAETALNNAQIVADLYDTESIIPLNSESSIPVQIQGADSNQNISIIVKIGNKELTDITTEIIRVSPEAQRQIRRVANG